MNKDWVMHLAFEGSPKSHLSMLLELRIAVLVICSGCFKLDNSRVASPWSKMEPKMQSDLYFLFTVFFGVVLFHCVKALNRRN